MWRRFYNLLESHYSVKNFCINLLLVPRYIVNYILFLIVDQARSCPGPSLQHINGPLLKSTNVMYTSPWAMTIVSVYFQNGI